MDLLGVSWLSSYITADMRGMCDQVGVEAKPDTRHSAG